jgi:hypothetical protein
MGMPATATAIVLATALALAGCTQSDDGSSQDATGSTRSPSTPTSTAGGPTTGSGDPVTARFVGLQPVGSCDALLDHYVDNALELVTPWGLGGDGGLVFMEERAGAFDSAESLESSAAATGGDEPAFSTTNVQEEGVDEPDGVKTDGALLVAVVEGGVRVVDVATTEVVGSVALDEQSWGGELLLSGDDLLVLTTAGSWGGPVAADLVPAFQPTRTVITRIDLSDPSDPEVVGTTTIEGSYRSARMVDDTVRLVVQSPPPGLAFTTPQDGGLRAEEEALEENRRIIRESELDDWIPHMQVAGPDGEPGPVQPLLECGDVTTPDQFAGFDTLSVLTMAIDDDAMVPTSAAGIVASGETVYASTDRLIVATSPWGRWLQPFLTEPFTPDDTVTTQLHSFDISDPSATTHVASAEVEGTLVNQFALSEVDGIVRVATTTQPDWWGGDEDSQSSLVVFAERGGDLVETGRVDGLGLTERIYSVRYLSPDVAAIVTFRQTDPLYLVDTSDPTAPRVAGELKIPGFSTYLHPIGDGALLGVGQDADEEGRTEGLQLSLFDIGDLSDPQRVDTVTWPRGWSVAEHDHRAFLYWAPTGQVVLPAEVYGEWEEEDGEEPPKPFVGAFVVAVDGDSLVEQGAVTQDGGEGTSWEGSITRSIVIGDDLWTVGWDSVARHDLATLEHEALLRIG